MKKRRGVIFFILTVVMLISNNIYAAPHHGDEWDLQQPDGSIVPVRIWGDEFYQDIETPDGFTLIRDDDGWICFAELSDDSLSYVSTGIRYIVSKDSVKGFVPMSNAPSTVDPSIRIKPSQIQNLRMQKMRSLGYQDFLEDTSEEEGEIQLNRNFDEDISPAPTPGDPDTVYGLALLIDFSDETGSIPVEHIDNLFNQRNYSGYSNHGSVMDYFYDQSDGQLVYLNVVTEYVRVSNPKTYYDTPDGYGPTSELIQDALNRLAERGFDFGQISTEPGNNRRFRALNVYYAGRATQGWANGLWPHMGTFRGSFSWNGISFRRYQMTGIGNDLSIGTIIHENGHLLLGLADLYSYDGAKQGLGRYCVMATIASGKRPQYLNAYFRYRGHINNSNQRRYWTTLTDISDLSRTTTFTHVANSPYSYVYYGTNHGSARERYFIEARRRTGWDASFPENGLVIWHVDLDGSNTRGDGTHEVFIKQSDVSRFQRDDLFHTGSRTSLNDDSPSPSSNARWHNGNRSGLSIIEISAAGETMEFTIESENEMFDIMVSSSQGGITSPSGLTPAIVDENIVITMTPDPGFRIDTVSVNGNAVTPTNNSITINVDGETDEYFVRISYAIENHFVGNGNFMIKNSAGKYLVPGNSEPANGSFIIAQDSVEAWGKYWNLSRDGNIYNMRYHTTDLSMDITGASIDPGANAILWTTHLESNQNFYVIDIGSDSYNIRPAHSMLCLTFENETVKIDDSDEDFITYEGNWISTQNDNYYNSTRTYSNTAGNYYEFTFTGTEFRLITTPYSDRGIAEIYINDEFETELDLYASELNHQQVVYTKDGLDMGEHTIRVEVTGRNSESATNSWVMIDAIEYTSDNLNQGIYNSEVEGQNFKLIPFNYEPTVAIVTPENDYEADAPTSVEITVEASDEDGEIVLVEFFVDDNKVGETTSAPFTYTWNDVEQGSYTITAMATDDFGASTLSEPVNIIINELVVSTSQKEFVLEGNTLVAAPNPVVNGATIFYSSNEAGEATFEILTSLGKSVGAFKTYSVPGVINDFYLIDIEKLPKGEYFIVMTVNGSKKGVARFFKTN